VRAASLSVLLHPSMAAAQYFESSARHTLNYDEYAEKLLTVLSQNGAPKLLMEAMRKMDNSITKDRAYTAPEALNDSLDKTRLFEAFCDLDLLATTGPTSPRRGWQSAACRFFEENR
jgi:hypothetical protein